MTEYCLQLHRSDILVGELFISKGWHISEVTLFFRVANHSLIYTNYMHSVVTTHRLPSLETCTTSRITMGWRKTYLHTRGTNVVITIPPRHFHGAKFKRVFSAFKSDHNDRTSARRKNRAAHWKLCFSRKLFRQCASNAVLISCLRFIGAVPETANLTFKHPVHKSTHFSLRHRTIIVRELDLFPFIIRRRRKREYLFIATLEEPSFYS